MKPEHNWEPGASGATTTDSSVEGAENFKAEWIFKKKIWLQKILNQSNYKEIQ